MNKISTDILYNIAYYLDNISLCHLYNILFDNKDKLPMKDEFIKLIYINIGIEEI